MSQYQMCNRHKINYSWLRYTGLWILFWGCQAFASSAPESLIDRVLAKADAALLANRFTQPQNNNAFDRYRAVLMIQPENVRAKEGLEKIYQAYLGLAKAELESGSPYHAKTFIALLDTLYPGRLEVSQLRSKLPAPVKAISRNGVDDYLIKVFDLEPAQLQKRDQSIKQYLEKIAKRVEQSHEYVVIVARNDAEGRWIYQTMNKATPNYRVRGDMQIRTKPAIKLLEPL